MNLKLNEAKNQNISEFIIEKFPMASSPHLNDYFFILGYEESYIQEKIIKVINSKIESNKNNLEMNIFSELKCRHLPTILSSISSNFSEPITDENYFIENIFPIPPSAFYVSPNNFIYEPNPINIIYSNVQNNIVNFIYAYVFYEQRLAYNKSIIYIPKTFVIVSQYPFFNTYKKICKEILYSLFKNDLLEIPVEIQIYNIINFVPAPVNEKLNISFFLSNDLNETISKCNSNKDLINLSKNIVYNLNQLSGYRESEIDFSAIFYILPVDLVIQIYLDLLTKNTVAFFSKDIEKLNCCIYIFQQLFYPLNQNETINVFSPIRYFCSDFCEQNIVGFLCSYDDVEKYNPFRNVGPDEYRCLSENEENEDLNFSLFGCDLIVDLEKKCILDVDNNQDKMECYENHKNDKIIITNFIYNLLTSKLDEDSTELETSIFKLQNSLNNIISKLNHQSKKDIIPNFFNNFTKFNKSIQEAFYQFNLDISFLYFQKISRYNGDYRMDKDSPLRGIKKSQETDLNRVEYLFLNLFYQTPYCGILNNFIGGYSKAESLLYKTPRIIFENFISLKKISDLSIEAKNRKLINNCFEIIDNIYFNKDKDNKQIEKDFTFLDFYKYYKNNLASNVYNLASNEYVDVDIVLDENDEKNIKYYYNYKTINLDKNLIVEYIYMLEDIFNEKKNNIFPLNNISYSEYKPIEKFVTSISLFNSFENYYIDIKKLQNIDILIISIINIIALSISNKTLIPFTISVYTLFQKILISSRKFVEIILSISYRLLTNDENQNFYLFEKYFNLYTICIEANNIFPNDQLIHLKNEIYNFSSKVKPASTEVLDEKFKKIEELDTDKLYSVEVNKKIDEVKAILESNNLGNNIPSRIIFKSKHYRNKIISYNDIYSPRMLYSKSNEMLNSYFKDLSFDKINIYEYEKILIYLIFYSKIYQEQLPKDINKFLFYCLIVGR